jgi:hypothetical protein
MKYFEQPHYILYVARVGGYPDFVKQTRENGKNKNVLAKQKKATKKPKEKEHRKKVFDTEKRRSLLMEGEKKDDESTACICMRRRPRRQQGRKTRTERCFRNVSQSPGREMWEYVRSGVGGRGSGGSRGGLRELGLGVGLLCRKKKLSAFTSTTELRTSGECAYSALELADDKSLQNLAGLVRVADVLEGIGGILSGDVHQDLLSSADERCVSCELCMLPAEGASVWPKRRRG